MNCQHCNAENPNEAKFCKVCGGQTTFSNPAVANTKLSDTFLIINVGIVAFTSLIIFIIQHFATDWYQGGAKYAVGALWILQNLSTILIPLAIKNNTMKIIAIVITAIHVIYYVYGNINFMF
jgi:hypothetical protein